MLRFFVNGIFATLLVATPVVALAAAAIAQPRICSLYDSQADFSSITDYAPPVNVVSAAREPVLTALCENDVVSFRAESAMPGFWIYNGGYIYDSAAGWQAFQFDPSKDPQSYLQKWAEYSFITQTDEQYIFFVGFTCVLDRNSQYKCGCPDQACAQNLWQIQVVRNPLGSATPPPTQTPIPTDPGGGGSTPPPIPPVFEAVNAHRASIGRNAFTWNDFIAGQAQNHAENMAAGIVPPGHQGQEQRIQSIFAQVPEVGNACLEVVSPFSDPQEALSSWLRSDQGHKDAIEVPAYNYAGFGVAGEFSVGLICE